MAELWIRNPGAAVPYGPLPLARLRELAAAGLVLEQALVDDGRGDARRLAAWPELIAALNDPEATTWGGAVDRPTLNRAGAIFERATVPVAPTFAARPVLRVTGRDAVTPVEAAESPSVLETLAANVRHEAPCPITSPPWYRYPVARNLGRWLAFVCPLSVGYGLLIACGSVRFGRGMPPEDAAVATLYGGLVTLWTWQVWFLTPSRWRLLIPQDSPYVWKGDAA